jgi:hypothetical protein
LGAEYGSPRIMKNSEDIPSATYGAHFGRLHSENGAPRVMLYTAKATAQPGSSALQRVNRGFRGALDRHSVLSACID